MTKITAKVSTVLKVKPIDSSKLGSADKFIVAAGQSFEGVVGPGPGLHQSIEAWPGSVLGANLLYFWGPDFVVEASPELASAKAGQNNFFQKALNLLPQPDAQTCQSTCIAMVLGETDVWSIREALVARGAAGDPENMSKYLRAKIGDRYSFDWVARLEDVDHCLRSGGAVITHGNFTASGHVILLKGKDQFGYQVLDPWSQFNARSWRYDLPDVGFEGIYSTLLIYASCVAGSSLDGARSIYREGTYRLSEKGMWAHFIAAP